MFMNFRRRERKPDGLKESETNRYNDRKGSFTPIKSGDSHFGSKIWLPLLLVWIVVIHYFERVRVKSAIDACQWDKWENWPAEKAHITPHRIVLIADPQLVDDHTYPTIPRALNYVIRKMSDNYLFINHKYMQAYLDPDSTIFVGDLFDGGREWEDKPWIEEYKRFNRIFPQKSNRRSYRSLPGNHDIGFQNISSHVQLRFTAFFGAPNDYFELGNHTFVQLDTILLSHEDPEINQDAREFLDTVELKIKPEIPRIVLTHVPFYRDPNVEVCGPERESKRPFPLQRGHQYQTVIDFTYTEPILKNLRPKLVFSGDDHDYCDTVHVDYLDNTKRLAREISCKTASMTNGIKYPAYQLLSLNNPYDLHPSLPESKTYETKMCYLPNPYRGVQVYGALLLLSFSLLYLGITHPKTVQDYLERVSSSQILPQSLQTSSKYVNYSDHGRRKTFIQSCVLLLVFVLVLLQLYNRM